MAYTTGKWKESDAKKKWQKENTVLVGIKLQKSTDKDILDYLEQREKNGLSKSGAFKEALRLMMQQESK